MRGLNRLSFWVKARICLYRLVQQPSSLQPEAGCSDFSAYGTCDQRYCLICAPSALSPVARLPELHITSRAMALRSTMRNLPVNAPAIPITDDRCLPPLPLLLNWLSRAAAVQMQAVSLPLVPYGNACLPQILQMAGISTLILDHEGLPEAWIWEGAADSRVQVRQPQAEICGGPVHRGPLPPDHGRPRPRSACWDVATDNARLEDATATVGYALPADWDQVLDQITRPPAQRSSRRSDRLKAVEDPILRIFNPLPLERPCAVALPLTGTAPWALTDADGRRCPVQVCEGPFGPEMLASLRLGPLEARDLSVYDDPVSGPQWEVSETVIDNGRVRAELGSDGLITRLCLDGRYLPLTGPLPCPLRNGTPLGGESEITVLENGPVRARVAVAITHQDELLRLTYTLQADEPWLRITATWTGDESLELDHPTTWQDGYLHPGADVGGEVLEQQRSLFADRPVRRHGCRWAWLGPATGHQGLAVTGLVPLAISAEDGHLRVAVPDVVSYALLGHDRPDDQPGLCQLAMSLTMPAMSVDCVPPRGPALRLVSDGTLTPVWTRPVDNDRAETVLAECGGRAGRAYLYPLSRPSKDASLVDLRGTVIRHLDATAEEDAWVIDYRAGEVLIVRW